MKKTFLPRTWLWLSNAGTLSIREAWAFREVRPNDQRHYPTCTIGNMHRAYCSSFNFSSQKKRDKGKGKIGKVRLNDQRHLDPTCSICNMHCTYCGTALLTLRRSQAPERPVDFQMHILRSSSFDFSFVSTNLPSQLAIRRLCRTFKFCL